MPVGIEICALPYKDEQICRIIEMIEKDAKFREKFGYPDFE